MSRSSKYALTYLQSKNCQWICTIWIHWSCSHHGVHITCLWFGFFLQYKYVDQKEPNIFCLKHLPLSWIEEKLFTLRSKNMVYHFLCPHFSFACIQEITLIVLTHTYKVKIWSIQIFVQLSILKQFLQSKKKNPTTNLEMHLLRTLS